MERGRVGEYGEVGGEGGGEGSGVTRALCDLGWEVAGDVARFHNLSPLITLIPFK